MAVDQQLWDILNGKKARISRLTANGTPDYANAKGSVELCCNFSVQLEPQIAAGTTLTKPGSCVDTPLNEYIGPDRRTGLKAKVQFGAFSWAIADVIGDAQVGTWGGAFYPDNICNAVANVNTCVELWCDLTYCGSPIQVGGVTVYGRLILPWTYGWKQSTGISFGTDFSAHEYEFTVRPNPNFGIGPTKDLTALTAMGGPVAGWDHMIYWDTAAVGACTTGYIALPAAPT